jgi:hypothetical protein
VVVEAEVVKQSSRFAASPESHETANHGPPFTSISRTLFRQYLQIVVIAKRCGERVKSTLCCP